MLTSFPPLPASQQLQIDTTYPSPNWARTTVVGEVDLTTAQDLRDGLLNVLRAHPPVVLDIDLAGVTFLDCTGISALIAVRNAATHVDCRMRVSSPTAIVYRILNMTGLLSVLAAPTNQAQRPAMSPDSAARAN